MVRVNSVIFGTFLICLVVILLHSFLIQKIGARQTAVFDAKSISHMETVTLIKTAISITPTISPEILQISPTLPPIPKDYSYLSAINLYRNGKGLPSLSSEPHTCSFAYQRAQEVASSFSHAGFEQRMASNTFEYPSYSRVVENIALAPPGLDPVFMWIGSETHEENLRAGVQYGCIGQYGNYIVFEGWSP